MVNVRLFIIANILTKDLKTLIKQAFFYDLRVEIYDLRVMMHATRLLNLF